MTATVRTAHWITWEDHRRSREMANAFGARYAVIETNGPRWRRYPRLILQTSIYLFKSRPSRLFCQNPSVVLAALACALRPLLRYTLIVDRHSNFKLDVIGSKHLTWRAFHLLSNWTLRRADWTIVTNDALADIVRQHGGRAFVLQDRIPQLHPSVPSHPPNFMYATDRPQILCITTYASDEPITNLIAAARTSTRGVFYFTGDYTKFFTETERNSLQGDGVILTGFISDQDYVDLMSNSDVVVVLTLHDNLLNCGAYEAIALAKPMILSDTPAIREYFHSGVVYTESNKSAIADAIASAVSDRQYLSARVQHLKAGLIQAWENRFVRLQKILNNT